ncbi:unnamed protein product [Allacma fusca]|uniref:Maelstrom domain-containing protein n=1 Tax=Allacma fusca TaxID=39272 RepID=A0A8J2KC90_9HEXA|nr:unnamed protein product [Allacma fusca]
MPKPNGFLVFVRHRQLKSMKEGKPIESLKEAVNIFGGEWDVMNAADRKIFKDKAKRFRLGTLAPESFTESTIINDSTPSSSGKGNPKQFSCVNSLLEESNPTNVLFVVMSCNYFCHTRSNPYCYVPAEIGMCAFSIKLGVIDNYWTLVDPQILPKGKLLEAKELHELHRVPLPPFEPRFQDLERILLNISHFLQRVKIQN